MGRKISVILDTRLILDIVITLEQCKKILNNGERNYSDDQIKKIRNYLYFIGHIEIETDNNEN